MRRYFSTLGKAIQYSVDTVRRQDYENYLATLALPKQVRAAVLIVRALNVELSQIRDHVKDPQRGVLRMEWWRQTLDNLYEGTSPEQPVARALTPVIHRYKLPKHFFTRLIDAREKNLLDDIPADITEATTYCENTASCILYLSLICQGVQSVHADHAASHIGKAMGLTTMIRAIPYHIHQGRLSLPLNIVDQTKIPINDTLKGKSTPQLEEAIFQIASVAKDHIHHARRFHNQVPSSAKPVLLPVVPCDMYLDRLQKHHFNIFAPNFSSSLTSWQRLGLIGTLYSYKFRGTY